jgi:hypothetical protein
VYIPVSFNPMISIFPYFLFLSVLQFSRLGVSKKRSASLKKSRVRAPLLLFALMAWTDLNLIFHFFLLATDSFPSYKSWPGTVSNNFLKA